MSSFAITPQQLNDLVDFDKRADLARQRDLLAAQGGMEGLLRVLQTSAATGIITSPTETGRRQEVFGINKAPPPKSATFAELVWDAFQDRVLQILLVGAFITLAVGMWQDPKTGWHEGISIVLTVGIVVGCNCGNDYWKEKKFQAILARAAMKKCKVLRDSTEQVVWTTDLLVGDIVLLTQGDEVPADGLWLDGQTMVIDESALTGESDPFKKNAEKPSFFAGSLVTEHKGRMLVTAVGSNTTGGKIMELLNSVAKTATPLQEKLEKMAIDISKIAFVIALATWCGLLGWWLADLAHYGWQEDYWVRPTDKELVEGSLAVLVHDFVTVITLIVVAVPDGLPLATTLSLVFSMLNLMKRNNFVRNLAASETMGQVTCICSDKTGTLTQNKMTVTRTYSAGNITVVSDDVSARYSEDFKTIARDTIQANSTALLTVEADGSVTVTGSKTEGALFKFLDGIKMKSAAKYNKVREVGFTSDRKRMTTVVALGDGRHRVYTKGAPEMLLPLCKDFYYGANDLRPVSDSLTKEILATITDFASMGLRTILAAYRDLPAGVYSEALSPDELEEGCTGLLVFGIEDPVRPEVPSAIKTCQGAGVTVRMCTGDNPFTAKKIAKDCGIWQEGVSVCMEGPTFRALDEAERLRIIPSLHVLARSSPQDKFILVTSLKSMGEVVAVTGDGTNDAPALREANIGFAMGIQGTDVAKNASDIVLLDDRFDSILQALLWGRNAYQCVIKFLQFQFAINLTSCLITLIAACANMGTPLNAVMLLWINLIMDTLGALAMSTEAPDPRVLLNPPRRKDEPVLSNNMIFYVLSEACWQLLVQFYIMFHGYKLFGFTSDNKKGINTLVFNINILMQLVNEFNGRHLQWTWDLCYGITGNKTLVPILLLIGGVQFLLVQLAYQFVDCVPLAANQWLGCIIIALLGIPMGWVHQLGDLFGFTSARPRGSSTASLPRTNSKVHADGPAPTATGLPLALSAQATSMA